MEYRLSSLLILAGTFGVISAYAAGSGAKSAFVSPICDGLLDSVNGKKVVLFDLARSRRVKILPTNVQAHRLSGRFGTAGKKETLHQIIAFANEQFKRRGWSENFLEHRFEIADRFLPQSEYLYTTTPSGEINGSIGATIARGDGSREVLTMEESHGWKLKRPTKAGRCAKIIELRTYGISDFPNVKWDRNAPYALLWAGMSQLLQTELAGCPELMGKNILFTYGDETSIRMYRKMGFEVADPNIHKPVKEGDTTWQVLSATPENVLRNFLDRIQLPHEIRFDADEVLIEFPNGKQVKAHSSRSPKIDERDFHSAIEKSPENGTIWFNLAEDTEVAPGIWGKAGSQINYWKSGQLYWVESLAHPTEIQPGLFAATGNTISFHKNGQVAGISNLDRPFAVPGTGIVARADAILSFNAEGLLSSAGRWDAPAAVFPKEYPQFIIARDGQFVREAKTQAIEFELDSSSRLPRGVEVPEGVVVKAKFEWRGSKPELVSLRYYSPTPAPGGMDVIYRFETGKPVPTLVPHHEPPAYVPHEDEAVG